MLKILSSFSKLKELPLKQNNWQILSIKALKKKNKASHTYKKSNFIIMNYRVETNKD